MARARAGRRAGYRLIYMAEVKALCDWLTDRGEPAAERLCGELEDCWESRYREPNARTAFPYWPASESDRELLGQALADVRAAP